MFTCINCNFLPILSTCIKYAKAENFTNSIQMFLKPVTGIAYEGLGMKQMGETWYAYRILIQKPLGNCTL